MEFTTQEAEVTSYNLYEAYNPKESIATIDAADAHEALAKYSINEGFADPRQYLGTDEDFYYTLFDGTVGMVFTNTEIVAVPA